MKLGVDGYTRYVLVPVLSLFEMPRCDRLCTTFRLMPTLKWLLNTWSRLVRIDCFWYPVLGAMPPSCSVSPEMKYVVWSVPPVTLACVVADSGCSP